MAKNEMNEGKWVEQRLSALDPGPWQPDEVRGLAAFRRRQRAARRHLVEWLVASFAGMAACCILLVAFLSPGACAKSRSCSDGVPRPSASVAPTPVPAPVETAPPAPVQTATAAAAAPARPMPPQSKAPQPKPVQAPTAVNFKEAGLPGATIVCEIYTDYECPSCAMTYKDTVPLLTEQYVRTGKIRLLHRDLPLPQHPYAPLAARYANAAGAAGQYDLVVETLFRTQNDWSRDGDIDSRLMQVLSPGVLQKVRQLVREDAHLDDTVAADRNMAALDRVDHTPFFVIVQGGRRQAIPGVPQFPILRTYLDQLLAAH